MKTKETIETIKRLMEESRCEAIAAIHDLDEDTMTVIAKGDFSAQGAGIITLLGLDSLGNRMLAVIGAYCFARINRMANKNPGKFADYLTECASRYAQAGNDKKLS